MPHISAGPARQNKKLSCRLRPDVFQLTCFCHCAAAHVPDPCFVSAPSARFAQAPCAACGPMADLLELQHRVARLEQQLAHAQHGLHACQVRQRTLDIQLDELLSPDDAVSKTVECQTDYYPDYIDDHGQAVEEQWEDEWDAMWTQLNRQGKDIDDLRRMLFKSHCQEVHHIRRARILEKRLAQVEHTASGIGTAENYCASTSVSPPEVQDPPPGILHGPAFLGHLGGTYFAPPCYEFSCSCPGQAQTDHFAAPAPSPGPCGCSVTVSSACWTRPETLLTIC